MIKRKTKFQKELEKITQAMIEYQPEKIILFGSAATNNVNEDSDIDILVIKKSNKPYWQRQIEATLLYKGLAPMDIFVLTPEEFKKAKSENRMFIRQILNYGRTIYENSQSA